MQGHVSFICVCLAILASTSLFAQDRATLEKQRQKLEQQIKETNALLKQSEKEKAASVSNLQTLRAEISMRENVMSSLKQEMQMINTEINQHGTSLSSLQATMDELKRDQAQQMRNAYFEKQMSHPILFILSAPNLNEAFLRWQYQKQIEKARARTLDDLKSTTASIRDELSSLEVLKSQKQDITDDMQGQEAALRKSASAAQSMVSSLEKKERSLRNQLEKQQKQSKELAAEIERIIAAEIKKSAGTGNMPAAPALKALSTEFAKNKGQLPWPVDQGYITGQFGTHPHPVVKTINVSNNGIDITSPAGSTVRSIFGGKVVGRKFIPGFDHMVIIQHGSYYSVYSRLADVNVEIDQDVKARDVIGHLGKGDDGNPRLHLEIWENKVQLDPEKWISR